MSIASVRILRLALGTALSMWFSQAVGWPMSFVAPVFTSLILSLPLPALPFKSGVGFVVVLLVALGATTLLLPTLVYQPAVGTILLVLALYWSFYFTAKGGSALLGTFATVGIALTAAVGTVSVGAVPLLVGWVVVAAAVGVGFTWIAHAILPDSMATDLPLSPAAKPEPVPPDLERARWSAFRSLLVVLPVALWFLLSSGSAAYVPVMIKVASMGQQATNEDTRKAGRSLVLSTIIGGAGAVIGWQVLSIAPLLTLYVLLIGLAALLMGSRIFKGAGMHPDAGTWSYGYLTMIVILAPAVLDGLGGDAAGVKFQQRLVMFGLTTLYAVVAVYVVDAFQPRRMKDSSVPG
jgi:hypothetical protein